MPPSDQTKRHLSQILKSRVMKNLIYIEKQLGNNFKERLFAILPFLNSTNEEEIESMFSSLCSASLGRDLVKDTASAERYFFLLKGCESILTAVKSKTLLTDPELTEMLDQSRTLDSLGFIAMEIDEFNNNSAICHKDSFVDMMFKSYTVIFNPCVYPDTDPNYLANLSTRFGMVLNIVQCLIKHKDAIRDYCYPVTTKRGRKTKAQPLVLAAA